MSTLNEEWSEEWIKETLSKLDETRLNACGLYSKELGHTLSFFYVDMDNYIDDIDQLSSKAKHKTKLSDEEKKLILRILNHIKSYSGKLDDNLFKVSKFCNNEYFDRLKNIVPKYEKLAVFEEKLRKGRFTKSDLDELKEKMEDFRQELIRLDMKTETSFYKKILK